MKNRQGFIAYMAIGVFLIIGILAFHFRQMASEARFSAFRFEQLEVVKQIAEASMEEAFQQLALDLQNPDSSLSQKLRSGATSFSQVLTLVSGQNMSIGSYRSYYLPQVTGTVALIKLRTIDREARRFFQDSSSPDREILGTLELKVHASLTPKPGTKAFVPTCFLVRHHDVKIVTVVTPGGAKRTCYAQNFPLDYALLVGKGHEEFVKSEGRSLNPPDERLVKIIQRENGSGAILPKEKRGKIFFGGTGNLTPAPSADPAAAKPSVFCNISGPAAEFLPVNPTASGSDPNFLEIPIEKVVFLLPEYAPLAGKWKGATGKFWNDIIPVCQASHTKDPFGPWRDVGKANLLRMLRGIEANVNPGFQLLEYGTELVTEAETILEGNIRQRFHYFVSFWIDFSKAVQAGAVNLTGANLLTQWPCTHSSPELLLPQLIILCLGVTHLDQQQPMEDPPLISTFTADFPYKAGLTYSSPRSAQFRIQAKTREFPTPTIFTTANQTQGDFEGPGWLPFQHLDLRAAVYTSLDELAAFGLYDPKIRVLSVRGIIGFRGEPLVLGEAGPVTIRGRGIIISENGFEIRNALQKEHAARDLLVLAAIDGTIRVSTNQPIQAGLVAMNAKAARGAIIPSQPLNLFGAFAVDLLMTETWCAAAEHKIAYDSAFKVETPLWHGSLLRQVSYCYEGVAEP